MMVYVMDYFYIFMVLSGAWVFVSKRKHLLLMLLSLEFIVVSLFMGLMIILKVYGFESYFSMFYLTFSVCEGALGLGILVSLIRTHGNDYFNSFNVMQC
uniref:NADH-ubiquinone oxidoreductase chain 4L n=1 Tax=Nevromus exterior TaxID=1569780 RepID=A0A3G1BU01_9NEOP|nr:NADH dehydrogenase subunit 4L [Nevromus exterior]AKA94254.1 NADH dehydrogenase subunit 4L [Nevromus exterior]